MQGVFLISAIVLMLGNKCINTIGQCAQAPAKFFEFDSYTWVVIRIQNKFVSVHGTSKLEIWPSCFCTVLPNFYFLISSRERLQKFILFVNSETFVIDNLLVTTHVVRLKLFRLKAGGVRRVRLPYFSGNIWFLHQTWLQNALFPNSLQPIHLSSYTPIETKLISI